MTLSSQMYFPLLNDSWLRQLQIWEQKVWKYVALMTLVLSKTQAIVEKKKLTAGPIYKCKMIAYLFISLNILNSLPPDKKFCWKGI